MPTIQSPTGQSYSVNPDVTPVSMNPGYTFSGQNTSGQTGTAIPGQPTQQNTQTGSAIPGQPTQPTQPTQPAPAPVQQTAPATPSTPPPKTGDKVLDANLAQQQQLKDQSAQAYAQMNEHISQLMTGPLQLSPEQQQYLNAMQGSLAASQRVVQQAADASTAVTREALARSGATQTSPQVAASQIALSIQAGANQVQQISANANMEIAQFDMNIRSGQIAAAQANYQMFEQYQKDQADALQNMYKDVADHEQQMRDYGLAVAQYNLAQADFVGKYGITPSQALNGGFGNMTAPVQKSQVSLGSGVNSISYLDTSAATFKSLPPGEQKIMIQNAQGQGVNVIDSSSEQGKTFITAMNALQNLQDGIKNGTISWGVQPGTAEPLFKAENLPGANILGIPILGAFGIAKKGTDIQKALGLNEALNISPNATVGDAITALQTQMATASGMTLPEFIQSQQVGSANSFMQANTGNASAAETNAAASAWGSSQ